MSQKKKHNGDSGFSCLFNGEKKSKCDKIFKFLGTIDEIIAFIGVSKTFSDRSENVKLLNDIQKSLILLNADVAKYEKFDDKNLINLEEEVKILDNELPRLKKFIIPGENKQSAFLHVARTLVRKAELLAWKLKKKMIIDNEIIPIYLNRLSDYLFIIARSESDLKKESQNIFDVSKVDFFSLD